MSLLNRPYLSSSISHFKKQPKCQTILVKMSFVCMRIKNHFHINGFALSLALKQAWDNSEMAWTSTLNQCYFFPNRCRPTDGMKECLPSWFGAECLKQCVPRDDDEGHYFCAHDGSKTCMHGWHGVNCTVFCVPESDDESGYYACDNEGKKVCFDGFHGFTINCSSTCLPENDTVAEQVQYKCTDNGDKVCNQWWYGSECSEYCVPHNDTIHGHYTCDPRDGSKVCLKGWEGTECRFPRRRWVFKIEWPLIDYWWAALTFEFFLLELLMTMMTKIVMMMMTTITRKLLFDISPIA